MTDDPHSGLDSRIQGWRSLEREYVKNVRIAQAVYDKAPSAKRRSFLVQALSALETARAHLDALVSSARVGSAGYNSSGES